MIVAYIGEDNLPLRQGIKDVVGEAKVTFRDPLRFQAVDADPLDIVVYVAEADIMIHQAYAAFPGVTLLFLDAMPIPELPPARIPRVRRSRSTTAPASEAMA